MVPYSAAVTGASIPLEETSLSPTDTARAKNLALALLAMAQFVVVLDASIVNVALPSIGRDLEFAQEDLSWVINAYTLTFGGFLLLGGRLADLLGRRRLFIWGMWVFALASLAGGLAQNDIWLVVARAAQGLGAAMISPAALAIVTTTFREGAERNKALGVWGAVAGSGGAAGVLLGGILTETPGWEWVLFVNTPIGIAAALLAPRLLEESREASSPSVRLRRSVLGHRRPGTARVHPDRCRERRLGLDRRRSCSAGYRSCCWWPSSSSRAAGATRSCRSRSSGCGRCAAPT